VTAEPARKVPDKKRKLSYKDQRELDSLPGLIESLEAKQTQLETDMTGADFYQQDHTAVQSVLDEVRRIQQELEQAMERWAELED
jgi:ATP-binding cassette subfamily F protein uup